MLTYALASYGNALVWILQVDHQPPTALEQWLQAMAQDHLLRRLLLDQE